MCIQTDNRKRVGRLFIFMAWFSCIVSQSTCNRLFFPLFIAQIIPELYNGRGVFTRTPLTFRWTLLEPPHERGLLPCPFCCPRGPPHWQWCHLSPGGTPPSDLWSGKTDELLLPPCFFARSILHVGVRFMNDGDLLKPSIQLPKDTALAPIAPTRQE